MRKLNNYGFSLVELLAVIVVLSLIAGITLYSIKNTFSFTNNQIDIIQDKEIEDSVRNYIIENNIVFNEFGYTCISVSELIDMGYLKKNDYNNRIIRVQRDNYTYVINNIFYDDDCK